MKIKIDNSTRKVFTSKPMIGVVGEIGQETISVSFCDEFIDGFAFLEIDNGQNVWQEIMSNDGDEYTLVVGGNILSVAGDISLQFKVSGNALGTGTPIFKSEVFRVTVYRAIGAEEIIRDYSNLLNVVSRTAKSVSSDDLYGLGKVGAYAFYNYTNLEEIVLPEGCVSIGAYAFYGCSSLRRVVLPSTLKTIGEHAFDGCTSLVDIDLKDVNLISDYGFYGCSALQKIRLLSNTIGTFAFANCTGLQEVEIEFAITIYSSAFDGCTNINKVSCPNLETWTTITFKNETANPTYYAENLWIDDTLVTELELYDIYSCGSYAFANCKGIVSVVCPAIVGTGAFFGCSGITDVYMYENVEYVSNKAFIGCDGILTVVCVLEYWFSISFGENYSNPLQYSPEFIDETTGEPITSLVIPSGVGTINPNAFYGYTRLEEIIDNDILTDIGIDAFNGCTGLQNVSLGSRLTQIRAGVFANCVIGNFSCSENVSTVSTEAFTHTGITSLTAPLSVINSVTLIPNTTEVNVIGTGAIASERFAFTFITTATIGDGITAIGEMAFQGSKLETLDIGVGVTSIGAYAFETCTELVSITINRTDSVISLGNDAFSAASQNYIVYVPASLLSAYQSATGWNEIADHIQAIPA